MKKWESELNRLPKECVEALRDGYFDKEDTKHPKFNIKICFDPQVEGTIAIRLHRPKRYGLPHGNIEHVDFLWYAGELDEVEFPKWPPPVGTPKFFI